MSGYRGHSKALITARFTATIISTDEALEPGILLLGMVVDITAAGGTEAEDIASILRTLAMMPGMQSRETVPHRQRAPERRQMFKSWT